ncbi:MAG TPA: hypothetical protein VL403_06495, partial [Candidatus Kryptonia bacterium]|nr:hypothetical protein [Candidatus Kryptonia bacterium]
MPSGIPLKSVTDVNGGNLEPGDVLQYTIALQNQSGFTVNGIEFTDSIPAHTSYVAASVSAPTGATVVSETPTLRIQGIDVPAHATVFLSFTARLDDPLAAGVTQITNQGTVSYDSNGDGITDSTQLTDGDTTQPGNQPTIIAVTAGPNFGETTKAVALQTDADGDGVVSPGDTLRYVIVVPNTGNQDSAGVVFQDSIPTNATYIVGSVGATRGSADYNAAANRIEWTGDIAAGASVSVTFDVSVNSGIYVGTVISNQGTVFYDSNNDGVDVNGGSAEPGDVLLYSFVGQNHSGFALNRIEFVDSIPAHTTYVPGSAAPLSGATLESETPVLRVTGISVPAHGQVTGSFAVQIDNPLPAGVTQIANQGTIFYDSNNDGVDVNGGSAEPGDVLLYSFVG